MEAKLSIKALASELNQEFLDKLIAVFGNKEIEIIIQETESNQNTLKQTPVEPTTGLDVTTQAREITNPEVLEGIDDLKNNRVVEVSDKSLDKMIKLLENDKDFSVKKILGVSKNEKVAS